MARTLRSDEEVKAIAVYLASLPPPMRTATVTGDQECGKNLYTTCSACHGQERKGNAEVKSSSLLLQGDWYLVSQLKKFRAGQRGAHKDDAPGTQMRAMTMMLPDDQALNRTTGDWHSFRPALKHRAQVTKGTKVPSKPGLQGFVP
jgi:cytochrome c553